MSKDVASQPKKKLDSSIVVDAKWVTVRKDHYLSNGGQTLEYWLVERSDSAIILVRQGGKFVLGDQQMRPGVEQQTLDFPGGRVNGDDPKAAAEQCVRREFQLDVNVGLPRLELVFNEPLFVDSAFSNQKVYAYTVDVPEDVALEGTRYTTEQLFERLQCLQCRAALLEWVRLNP